MFTRRSVALLALALGLLLASGAYGALELFEAAREARQHLRADQRRQASILAELQAIRQPSAEEERRRIDRALRRITTAQVRRLLERFFREASAGQRERVVEGLRRTLENGQMPRLKITPRLRPRRPARPPLPRRQRPPPGSPTPAPPAPSPDASILPPPASPPEPPLAELELGALEGTSLCTPLATVNC